jgi:Co/Zn/Cd efflux system component
MGNNSRNEPSASPVACRAYFALAAYVVLSPGWGLWTHHSQSFSLLGVAVAGLAIPVMAILARLKISVAEKINGRALRADGMESVTCGWLSIIVLTGSAAQYLLHVWWIDSVVSLGILYFLIKEGREAWSARNVVTMTTTREVNERRSQVLGPISRGALKASSRDLHKQHLTENSDANTSAGNYDQH